MKKKNENTLGNVSLMIPLDFFCGAKIGVRPCFSFVFTVRNAYLMIILKEENTNKMSVNRVFSLMKGSFCTVSCIT